MDPKPPSHRFERRAGVDVLTWPVFDELPLDAVVTTRGGGVSDGPYTSMNLGLHVEDDRAAVLENRSRAAATIGLTLDDLVFCRQAHDRRVVRVTVGDRGRGARGHEDAIADTDALVTTEPGVGLVVIVADCVPIVMFCPEGNVLATVHAGWGGTTRRVVAAAVEVMVQAGARPEAVRVALGPAIPAARYQVGDDVLAAAEEAFGDEVGTLVVPDGTGRWRFDLWAANLVALRDSGIDDRHVSVAELGTGDGTPFFSHRALRPCGRFAALARMTEPG